MAAVAILKYSRIDPCMHACHDGGMTKVTAFSGMMIACLRMLAGSPEFAASDRLGGREGAQNCVASSISSEK